MTISVDPYGMVFQYGPLILENMIRRLNKSNGGLQD